MQKRNRLFAAMAAQAVSAYEKTVRCRRILPPPASFPGKRGCTPRSSRGAWGVAPNGTSEPKQNGTTKLESFGAKPQRPGCRGIIPLPGFGVEPQRPPPPHGFVDHLAGPSIKKRHFLRSHPGRLDFRVRFPYNTPIGNEGIKYSPHARPQRTFGWWKKATAAGTNTSSSPGVKGLQK